MKSIKIKNFNSNGSDIKVDKFYNFYPQISLKPVFSVKPVVFPEYVDSDVTKELTYEDFNILGVSSFKEHSLKNNENLYRIFIYGDDGKLYINQLFCGIYGLYWLYDLAFESAPISMPFKNEDTDAIVLASKEKMVIWKSNYSPYTIKNVPVITSMCMNDGVLFCTITKPAFKIWYATDLNAEKVGQISANSGYISLEDELGDARKTIAFDGDVFVFRDYGISKINYLQNSITVSQVYASNSRIIANSVAACGNSIFFLTLDGIYSFNGVKVNKLDVDIMNLLTSTNPNAVASSLGNYYYLALNLNYGESNSSQNNSIIILNVVDSSFQIIRGLDVLTFYPLKTDVFEKMLVVFNDNKKRIFEITNEETEFYNDFDKSYTTENIFEDNNTKLVTRFLIDSSKNVTFSLITDEGKTVSFTTKKDGISEFNFRKKLSNAKLEITSNYHPAYVNSVEIDYYDN